MALSMGCDAYKAANSPYIVHIIAAFSNLFRREMPFCLLFQDKYPPGRFWSVFMPNAAFN
jgi:hypothetical protein